MPPAAGGLHAQPRVRRCELAFGFRRLVFLVGHQIIGRLLDSSLSRWAAGIPRRAPGRPGVSLVRGVCAGRSGRPVWLAQAPWLDAADAPAPRRIARRVRDRPRPRITAHTARTTRRSTGCASTACPARPGGAAARPHSRSPARGQYAEWHCQLRHRSCSLPGLPFRPLSSTI